MGEKKGKSLVMKLIDDLMDGEESPTSSGDDQENTGAPTAPQPPEKAQLRTTEKLPVDDLELSDVIKVPEEKTGTVTRAEASQVKEKTKADDPTMRLSESKILSTSHKTSHSTVPPANGETVRTRVTTSMAEPKSAVGRVAPIRSSGFNSATEAALATSENLRIAQNRILELEQEISRLRTDNEQLAAAGETLRRRADELLVQVTALDEKMKRSIEARDQEIEILKKAQAEKDKEASSMKLKIEEMEMRLSSNIQKIRVRERELENRLELVRMESTALVRSKDEIILDLKRQLDQLTLELENYRNKGQELNRQIGDKQEMLRRTVKALRLALSMLEGEEEPGAQKKVK